MADLLRKQEWHRACDVLDGPGATTRPKTNKGVRPIRKDARADAFFICSGRSWMSLDRRDLLKKAGAAGLMGMVPETVRIGACAAGSDAPEKKEVRAPPPPPPPPP